MRLRLLFSVEVNFFFFFFFQAEDGIRDLYVTGVQTCALPISWHAPWLPRRGTFPVQSLQPLQGPHLPGKIPTLAKDKARGAKALYGRFPPTSQIALSRSRFAVCRPASFGAQLSRLGYRPPASQLVASAHYLLGRD